MVTITQEELKEYLKYDEHTGEFTWIKVMSNRTKKGDTAGKLDFYGRRVIGFKGKIHFAHRLAFVYMTGKYPEKNVDHINGNNSDNRWVNLRDVSKKLNGQNRRGPNKKQGRTSKYLGVSKEKSSGKFISQISKGKGQNLRIGRFECEKEAYEAYLTKKREIHEGNTL